MNILPKKSWHVRNKDNVAKVRRDEQKAKEEADELDRRYVLAEKEAIIDSLRFKKHGHEQEGNEKEDSLKSQGHINFFQEYEDQSKAVPKNNPEYEAEKKAEKEAYEKKIGILTYLGQSVTKKQEEMPWYLQKQIKKESSARKLNCSDDQRKDMIDPLQDVQKHLKKMKSTNEDDKELKKSKKSKYKDIIKASKGSSTNLDDLRAKRLKREQEERGRTEKILGGKNGKTTQPEEADSYDPDRYSSQYNPQFARKHRDHKKYEPY